VPDDHPLNLNWGSHFADLAQPALAHADLVLVVGSSLDDASVARRGFTFPANLIQIDIAPEVIGRTYPEAVALAGDARTVLRQILAEMGRAGMPPRRSTSPAIAAARADAMQLARQSLPWQYMDAIQRTLAPEAIVTNDASHTNGWAVSFLNRYLPNTFSLTHNLAALGYAWPSALGAKLAYPQRQALAIAGDGGFLFNANALATAVQHRLNAVAIVFNDGGYSTITRMQTRAFGRTIGADLVNPDFVKLAQAYGAAGERADNPGALHDALLRAWQRDLPTLIEVPVAGA
jgi:acetolactate synthase I/II/III large subunit